MQPLRLSSRSVLLPTLLVLASLLCLPAARAGTLRRPAPAVELDVVDRHSGTVLPQYRHAGRTWLPGEPGHAYALRLRNTRPQRLLVVLSVDGINAIDGRSAAPDQAGYVLGPWQNLEVSGWRKSLQDVARFEFVDPAASYAARTGRPGNAGVIGIAVFAERIAPAPAGIGVAGGQIRGRASDKMAAETSVHAQATAPAAALPPQLGTGHGPREQAQAYRTRFQRLPHPLQITRLRYDTVQALLARGVPVRDAGPAWPYAGAEPQAFPGAFVPDPPCCDYARD